MALVLVCLVLAVVVAAAAFVYALRSGLAAWRDFKALMRGLGTETDALAQKVEKLASFEPPDLDPLTDSFARLQRDRAQLSILLGALGRAREQFSAFAAVYPRK